MSGRFVRASKYRHVFGQPAKKELCYENIKVTKNAWDSNLIKTNGKYLSVNWDASGGGAFAVIPLKEVGKAPDQVPLFRGHTAAVLDTDWNPFNDSQLVSSSDDGKISVWEVPEDYSFFNYVDENGDPKDITPIKKLSGHTRKVGHVQFHPIAEDILLSSSLDYSVKIWNVKTGENLQTLQHKDLVTSFAVNWNGTLVATTSRDKKLRVWDIRSAKIISEGSGHTGAKASRVVWLGNSDRIATTGFSKLSDRQIGVWNTEDIASGPIGGFYTIDLSAGILMPFFDAENKILYLAGKGDGNIRYYEFSDDELFQLSEFHSVEPQRGFAVAPKRTCSIHDNEILRAFKSVNDNYIEPISFIVPRRSETFQDDIYSDCPGDKPALSADEWWSGKEAKGPILISLRDVYEGSELNYHESTQSPEGIKRERVDHQEETSEEVKKPIKVESNSASVKQETSSAPAFSKTQEKGVDELLAKKEVNTLLDKVNNLSDDEPEKQEEDGDWDEAPKRSAEASEQLKIEPEVKKESKVVEEQKVEPKEEPKVKQEPKEEPKKEVKTQEKPDKVPQEEPSKPLTEAQGSPKKTLTLKETVEKLGSLVVDLESQISRLVEANLAKDEKLDLLQKKLDSFLDK
ncbi:hypothetical protein LJB42_004521 [Komagataella kurtzmanii]|nr:hypothetical protein LJB42_004521 [Komagataella kurtzmanii]